MSEYITTYSKIHIAALQPKAEDITITDIAHALSYMCRANGHVKHFYSVAQHSINCAKEALARGATTRVQLACLLHDGSEAYLSDITRPVKCHLTEYLQIEERLQSKIFEVFGLGILSKEEQNQVSDIDDTMLYYEFLVLMGERVFDYEPVLKSIPDFEQQSFTRVENEFLCKFRQLTDSHYQTAAGQYIGIDGSKNGWIAVTINPNSFEVLKFKTISDICSKYQAADSIIIDMAIGLPESDSDIRPDAMLRTHLKGKASSVFNIPCRQAIYMDDYDMANQANKNILNKGLSKQSFAICNKIREIDMFLLKNTTWQNRLMESHPELCFAKLNGGAPIIANKKTPEGVTARINVLQKYYDKSYEVYQYATQTAALENSIDDVLDALCLAVTGLLGCKNGFFTIPENPTADSNGLKMQIVYAKPE